jgi:hypothetical protein
MVPYEISCVEVSLKQVNLENNLKLILILSKFGK